MDEVKKIITRAGLFEEAGYFLRDEMARAAEISGRIAIGSDLVMNQFKTFGSYVTKEGKVVTKNTGIFLGGKVKTEKWTDIKSLAALQDGLLGLKNDGTVVYAGRNPKVAKSVTKLENIVQIHAADWHFAALKNDGTVYEGTSFKGRSDVNKRGFVNARQVLAMPNDTLVVLQADGTVAGGTEGMNSWRDIVYLTSNCEYEPKDRIICGLKRDGSVCCNHTGLKAALSKWDSPVVAIGIVKDHERNLAIVGITAGGEVRCTMIKSRYIIEAKANVAFTDYVSLFTYDGNVWGIRKNGELKSLSASISYSSSGAYPEKIPL